MQFKSFNAFQAYFSQMSEEIDNAALNVPRAIFTTMLINGATGFGMVLAVLFCLGDVETVLVKKTLVYLIVVGNDHSIAYTHQLPLHTNLL